MSHPARRLSFREIREGLAEAVAAELIHEKAGEGGLRLYCYTRNAVFDRQWTDFTKMARGLVLDVDRERVVATPFPKFFNAGETGEPIPDLPFETFEKVDGSLIILFWHGDAWRTATKGSLDSAQAQWAAANLPRGAELDRATTYLLEAVYPENRIVIRYEETGLVLLGAYDDAGEELTYAQLQDVGAANGWRVAGRHAYDSLSDLIATAKSLPASEEGFVLRFDDGHRLKVKGDEYCRIHALISNVTPLAMWRALKEGDDMQAVRRDLPEEFWDDFDQITQILDGQVAALVARAEQEAAAVAHLSDKEVGLRLKEFPADVRSFIFPLRNQGTLMTGKSRDGLFRAIRPTGNELPAYQPSYAISRVMDEST